MHRCIKTLPFINDAQELHQCRQLAFVLILIRSLNGMDRRQYFERNSGWKLVQRVPTHHTKRHGTHGGLMRLLRAQRNHVVVQWIFAQLCQQFHIIVGYFFLYNKCDKDLHRIWFLWLVSNKIGTLLPCSLPSTYTLDCSHTVSR